MAKPPGGQHTAAAARMLTACLMWVACAGGPSAPSELELPPDRPTEGVRVRLAFGPEADLDLHVTDPLQETVYFANTPSASGGALEADVRCDSAGPRVESVVFPRPLAGRYRVGVDFPIRCRTVGEPVPFRLEILVDGERHEQQGVIPFGRFEPIVHEFDVDP